MKDLTQSREEGYYWIYIDGIWSTGQYVAGTWFFIADSEEHQESEIQIVGARIVRDVHNHKSTIFTDQFFKEAENLIQLFRNETK
jgi:hypothetical protein